MNMNRFIVAVLFSIFPCIAVSQTNNLIYINGIQNTQAGHQESVDKIKSVLSESVNHVNNKIIFNIYGIWNPIGFNGTNIGPDLKQDKQELFLLKTAEEHFAMDFEAIQSPHNSSTVVSKESAFRVLSYLIDMTPGNNSLEDGDSPVTDGDMLYTKMTVEALVRKVKELGSTVVVAHSQGNLLANLAYAKLASEYGNDIKSKLVIVNVANTSQFSANNLNFSHAGDRALYRNTWMSSDLTSMPSVENWIRTTPVCSNSTCDFSLDSATFGEVDTGGFDFGLDVGIVDSNLQHGFITTYLSDFDVPVVLDSQAVTFTPNKTKFVDRFEDFVYTAANAVNFGISATNLLLGATVTDSCISCPTSTHGDPNNLTDGNMDSGRNLGTYSGSFNIFLSNPTTLSRLVLTPTMTPDGIVNYEIQTSTDPTGTAGTWTSHGQKSSTWVNRQDVEVPLNANTTGVRVVKVIVSSSPSWVQLNEVQGFAQ